MKRTKLVALLAAITLIAYAPAAKATTLECREVETSPPYEEWYECKADWNDKSRITDEQRETFTVIATTLLLIGSRLRQR